jgi:hypothetical protein
MPACRRVAHEAVELAEPIGRGWDHAVWNLAANVAAQSGNRRDAMGFYVKGIDRWHWLGWRPVLGLTIVGLGDVLAPDEPRAAAILHGAGDALAPEFTVPPASAERHREAIETIDAHLGPSGESTTSKAG